MERIDVNVSAFSQRARSFVVRHTETALTRGLDPGEQVEVHGGASSWVATVAEISFEMDDTVYRLSLPSAPTAPESTRRGPLRTADIVALLHDLAATTTPQRHRPLRTRRAGGAPA